MVRKKTQGKQPEKNGWNQPLERRGSGISFLRWEKTAQVSAAHSREETVSASEREEARPAFRAEEEGGGSLPGPSSGPMFFPCAPFFMGRRQKKWLLGGPGIHDLPDFFLFPL